MSEKKKIQLGMNPSTASGRLVKDLLWDLIKKTDQHHCCKCGLEMSRDSFSIEHIIPWLDSDDPVKLFFDLENISFSHHSCNVSDRRTNVKEYECGTRLKYSRGCRCHDCVKSNTEYSRAYYTKEYRKEKYNRTGN